MAELPAAVASAQISVQSTGTTKAAHPRDAKNIDSAAQDFEAVFLSQMLENMFKGVRTDGPFGGGKAEEMLRTFMLQEYGKVMAGSGGIGIADTVKREMLRAQEGK